MVSGLGLVLQFAYNALAVIYSYLQVLAGSWCILRLFSTGLCGSGCHFMDVATDEQSCFSSVGILVYHMSRRVVDAYVRISVLCFQHPPVAGSQGALIVLACVWDTAQDGRDTTKHSHYVARLVGHSHATE